MAYGTNLGYGKKIILLILFIIVLIVFGILLIDFVGNIFGVNIPLPGVKFIKKIKSTSKSKISKNPYLLEREEISKEKERLALQDEQVVNREKEVSAREKEAEKKIEEINKRQKELEEKAKLLDDKEKQYGNRQKNIMEQAMKLYSMPPKDAVTLLLGQSESDIVDILRSIDKYSEEIGKQSTSPYLLSLMLKVDDKSKQKAQNVLRKLKNSAGEKYSSVESLSQDAQDKILP